MAKVKVKYTIDYGSPRPQFERTVRIGTLTQPIDLPLRGSNYSHTITDGDKTVYLTNYTVNPVTFGIVGMTASKISTIFTYEDIIAATEPHFSGFVWVDIGNLRVIVQVYDGSVRLVNGDAWFYKGNAYTAPNTTEFMQFTDYPHWQPGASCGLYHVMINGKDAYMFAITQSPPAAITNVAVPGCAAFTDNVLSSSDYVDPYENGQSAGDPDESGGYGTGLPTGDNIPSSRVTGITPLGAGIHAYIIGDTQIAALMGYLWGAGFSAGGLWEKFKNYKFNPIAGIMSLHHIPTTFLVAGGSTLPVQLAGLSFDGVSTQADIRGAAIDPVNSISVVTTDTCYFTEDGNNLPYASFRDFARTRIRVYMPFCGALDVDPSACIGGALWVVYQCDNINGNLAAQVMAMDQYGTTRCIGTATGNCAYKIPLTGNDNGTGEILGAIKQTATSALTLNAGGIISGASTLGFGTERHNTTVSGNLAGNGGYLGNLHTVVQVSYGVYYDTDDTYSAAMGRPSSKSGRVRDFAGHSQLVVHADSISYATDAERLEIETMCREGVLI